MVNQENPPQNGRSTLKIVLIIGAIVLVIVFIVIAIWRINVYYALKYAEQGSTKPLSTSSATQSGEEQEIYDNRVYGYSLKYPSGWLLDENTADNVTEIYSNSKDVTERGVLIKISPVEQTDKTDIEEYIKTMPTTTGQEARQSTNYRDIMGVNMALTEQTNPKMRIYEWICGGQVMKMTYEGAQYDGFVNQLDNIVNSMVLCAG